MNSAGGQWTGVRARVAINHPNKIDFRDGAIRFNTLPRDNDFTNDLCKSRRSISFGGIVSGKDPIVK